MPKQKRSKIILGVTGSLACGKSTVARMFKAHDGELIDADRLAHESMFRGGVVYKKIVNFFGNGILKNGGIIDRQKLAGIVFIHNSALKKLNSIIHPVVIKEIYRRIRDSKKPLVILDAPLIIETGLRKMVDKLVVVSVRRDQQFSRAKKISALSNEQIDLRIKSQIPLRRKVRLADFIIDNSGAISKTRKQVSEIRRKLWKS